MNLLKRLVWRLLRLVHYHARLLLLRLDSLFPYENFVKEMGRTPSIRLSPEAKICIYAHNDRHGVIDDYVALQLEELFHFGYRTIFVTTSPNLSAESRAKVAPYCLAFVVRSGQGRDLRSYRFGYEKIENPENLSCLLFLNDSIYGPLFSMSGLIHFCENGPFDLTGATDSYEMSYHIQSYFLHYKKDILHSPGFPRLMQSIKAFRLKSYGSTFIEKYFTKAAQSDGFLAGAYCPYEYVSKLWLDHYILLNEASPARPQTRGDGSDIAATKPLTRIELKFGRHISKQADEIYQNIIRSRPMNPTAYFWSEIIDHGLPFFKAELLRHNPAEILDTDAWPQYVSPEYHQMVDIIRSNATRSIRGNCALRCTPEILFPWRGEKVPDAPEPAPLPAHSLSPGAPSEYPVMDQGRGPAVA